MNKTKQQTSSKIPWDFEKHFWNTTPGSNTSRKSNLAAIYQEQTCIYKLGACKMAILSPQNTVIIRSFIWSSMDFWESPLGIAGPSYCFDRKYFIANTQFEYSKQKNFCLISGDTIWNNFFPTFPMPISWPLLKLK